ncbi:zinc finger found in FPG and IleRS [Lactobacillus iners LactinV 03V1-b]|nr:zinc finger found in FPG and IleRS [Lactobacillus iners LactinV 03V1-b]
MVELFYDINNTIKIAIQYHGTTFHSFLDADGHTGKYQSMLKVYGKSGEPCSRCNTTLEKIKVNGRGTTFCPLCQVVYK